MRRTLQTLSRKIVCRTNFTRLTSDSNFHELNLNNYE